MDDKSLKKLCDFFFPDDTKLKPECVTRVHASVKDGIYAIRRIERRFYTLRSFLTFVLWETFVNPHRNAAEFWRSFEQFKYFSVSQIMRIGAIAFDAAASGQVLNNHTISFSHTSTGSNRVMTAAWMNRATIGGAETLSAWTYNSVSLTTDDSYNNTNIGSYIYGGHLIAPTTGSNTLSATGTGGTTPDVIMGVVTWTGADQTNPVDVHSTNTIASPGNTAPTITVTTNNNNSYLMDYGFAGVQSTMSATATAGQAEKFNLTTEAGLDVGFGSIKQQVTAGSVTMSWTLNHSQNWSVGVIAVNEIPQTNFTRSLSDSIMNGASRTATVTRVIGFGRSFSDSVMNGASRLATVKKGLARSFSDSVMNGASRLATVTRLVSFVRTTSDSILYGASRTTTVARIVAFRRSVADSVMNGASRLAAVVFIQDFKANIRGYVKMRSKQQSSPVTLDSSIPDKMRSMEQKNPPTMDDQKVL